MIAEKKRDLVVLVMSVGSCEKNGTVKFLQKIGAPNERIVVCLPRQFENNAESYRAVGLVPFIYDESKYINSDFEYFGFKPRNCGGVGRQGIAEATDKYDNKNVILLQLDDDTLGFFVRKKVNDKWKGRTIKHWCEFETFWRAMFAFYQSTGIYIAGSTTATLPDKILANRKVYNNFIMQACDEYKYDGFKARLNDDIRYNVMRSLYGPVAFYSVVFGAINFTQAQGIRTDGNAPLQILDSAWNKAFAAQMMFPQWLNIKLSREDATSRFQFREFMQYNKIYGKILLQDKDGNFYNLKR